MINQFKDEYRWLSNFAPCGIELDRQMYKSVEHAYQSAKSDDPNWKEFCVIESSPVEVKRKASTIPLRKDWENIKDDIMLHCLKQKFSRDPYKTHLINTQEMKIQEGNWWGDEYWGVNFKTGKGQNKLGKMIMQIRSELK